MLQVNNEWVYEDLDKKNIIEIIEIFKSGKEPKRGPQIERNHAEGPDGRTCLVDFDETATVFERDFAKVKQEWEEKKAAQKK